MKLRTVIADDEPLARDRLKLLLSSDAEIEIVKECRNGKEAVATLKSTQVDLLFLDIQMPGGGGFDVIEAIGLAKMPMTVFVTAHNEYAVEAFKVHALDYLVKPFERQRLGETLTRVKERVRLNEAFLARQEISSVLKTLQMVAGQSPYPQRLLAKNGEQQLVVMAHYSDRSTRDVTHLAMFQSNESVIAAVNARPSRGRRRHQSQGRAPSMDGSGDLRIRPWSDNPAFTMRTNP